MVRLSLRGVPQTPAGPLSVPGRKFYAGRYRTERTRWQEGGGSAQITPGYRPRQHAGKVLGKNHAPDCARTRGCNWLGFTMRYLPLYK
ncbi:protein of unknown function [Streptomyces sp. KY75]|nr:protein of unknown function [Streptomyces sp. KY70]CAD5975682.1 protein of unknown function [Streptomyces sp. KY75]